MNEVEHLLIGAPGSGAPRRFGGVCAQVVASAPCTVTVVRPRAKG
jgi:nucleotide-binding universal stress UspA family protein